MVRNKKFVFPAFSCLLICPLFLRISLSLDMSFHLFRIFSLNMFFHPVHKPVSLVRHSRKPVCPFGYHPIPKHLNVFHTIHEPVSAFILFPNLSVSLLFHPLPKPVCLVAFSSSSRTCLSRLAFSSSSRTCRLAFSSCSRASLFPLLHKPVWQHAKCIRQSLSSQSEIGDILILMQKSGILLIRNEK